MLRMRAPRPYPGASTSSSMTRSRVASEPDKQHRPRERRAGLDDLPVARQQLHEGPLGPGGEMARRVAQVLQVGPACQGQGTPQRLARAADQPPAHGGTRTRSREVLSSRQELAVLERDRTV